MQDALLDVRQKLFEAMRCGTKVGLVMQDEVMPFDSRSEWCTRVLPAERLFHPQLLKAQIDKLTSSEERCDRDGKLLSHFPIDPNF